MRRGGSRSLGTAIFSVSAGPLLWQRFFYPLTLMALGALRGRRQQTYLSRELQSRPPEGTMRPAWLPALAPSFA